MGATFDRSPGGGARIELDGGRGAALAAPPPDTSAARADASTLLAKFLDGPLRDVESVVFAARALNPTDGHWYANFGYYSHDPDRKAYAEGTKLYRLNLRTRALTTLLADTTGGVRDPQVSYDGRKILFSYRPGGTEHYHLYEMNADGSGMHQLTSGNFDDIEAAYLPDGGIVFVSSRCKRWVNCWLTQVAVLHRCDADGSNIRALSSNNEHDNTPWPLTDGRILYTRWEYVDRGQVHFHHLWAANPDGTSQMTWFGNLHPGITMIDAKPSTPGWALPGTCWSSPTAPSESGMPSRTAFPGLAAGSISTMAMSTCGQYQCRFKRTGQFWSRDGDEALMCLETFWRNGRWHDLFPHSMPPSPANN